MRQILGVGIALPLVLLAGCTKEGFRDFAGGVGRGMQQQAAQPAPQIMRVFQRSYISGTNRICVYDQAGSEVIVTVSAASICPL